MNGTRRRGDSPRTPTNNFKNSHRILARSSQPVDDVCKKDTIMFDNIYNDFFLRRREGQIE